MCAVWEDLSEGDTSLFPYAEGSCGHTSEPPMPGAAEHFVKPGGTPRCLFFLMGAMRGFPDLLPKRIFSSHVLGLWLKNGV